MWVPVGLQKRRRTQQIRTNSVLQLVCVSIEGSCVLICRISMGRCQVYFSIVFQHVLAYQTLVSGLHDYIADQKKYGQKHDQIGQVHCALSTEKCILPKVDCVEARLGSVQRRLEPSWKRLDIVLEPS